MGRRTFCVHNKGGKVREIGESFDRVQDRQQRRERLRCLRLDLLPLLLFVQADVLSAQQQVNLTRHMVRRCALKEEVRFQLQPNLLAWAHNSDAAVRALHRCARCNRIGGGVRDGGDDGGDDFGGEGGDDFGR